MNKKFSHFLGTFCLAAIFALFALSNSKAQVISGDLVGTVLDKSGAAVPGASIEAVNVDTGVNHTTKTNEAGEYRFTNLPVGSYNVSASPVPSQINETSLVIRTIFVYYKIICRIWDEDTVSRMNSA